VYAEAQQYGRFLSGGEPINFSVPKEPGIVVSGLKLADRVLMRRTDFGETSKPVEVTVDETIVKIPVAPRRCRIVSLR
jgi:hypothetical protein